MYIASTLYCRIRKDYLKNFQHLRVFFGVGVTTLYSVMILEIGKQGASHF